MKLPVFLAFLFFFVGLASAQNLLMDLPEGNGVWIIEVQTTGGFTGGGIGNFRLLSTGIMSCSGFAGCPKSINVPEFHPLVETIQKAPAFSAAPELTAVCSGCITRTIRITQRDTRGVVHNYSATWNEMTMGRVPIEVRRVYEAVMALRK